MLACVLDLLVSSVLDLHLQHGVPSREGQGVYANGNDVKCAVLACPIVAHMMHRGMDYNIDGTGLCSILRLGS